MMESEDAASRRAGPTMRIGLVSAAACLLATTVPYLFAYFFTPADRVYLGLMLDAPDHAQYWSWVTASSKSLFISNTMTPEPNAATFVNPAMWMLARVQATFGLSFPALFQWWRLAAAAVIGPALAFTMRRLARTPEQARLAFWIALLGGGLGWLLVAAKYVLRLPEAPFPMAIYIVEPNTWLGLLAYPYLPLAQGFMLLALTGAFRAHVGGRASAFAVCAVGGLGVALLHAYDLVVVYAVMGTFWMVETARLRRVPWRLSGAIVVVLVCSAPLAGYYQYLTSSDPLWRSVLSQYVNAGVWTPPPWLLVVLMGAPLVLAVWRLASVDLTHDGTRFVTCWAVVGGLIIYAPTVFQVKLLAAFQVPLALLAADLWTSRLAPRLTRWASAFTRPRLAAWAPLALLAMLVLPTNLYLLVWRVTELRRPDAPYYVTRDERAALDALRQNSGPTDVALALEPVGRWVPNYGNTRSYLAHWAMTTRYFERRDRVSQFFSPEVSDAWRREMLAADRVTMVVWTNREAAEGRTYYPGSSPLFEPLFVAPTAGVYRVRAGAQVR